MFEFRIHTDLSTNALTIKATKQRGVNENLRIEVKRSREEEVFS